MSTPAYIVNVKRREARRIHLRRLDVTRQVAPGAAVPWSDIPLGPHGAQPVGGGPRRGPVSLWSWRNATLVLLVAGAHLAFAWYANHRPLATLVKAPRSEVNVELERPKPAPPPRIDPPKPQPKPQAPPQILPPIQQDVPPASEPAADSNEPAVAVAPTAPAPAPAPVTAAFGRAGYLNNTPPEYPPAAARVGMQGTVLLRVRVLANGTVESVQVQKSSGSRPLDDAAVATVRKWLFSPTKRGDTPIDGWASVPIEFKLD